MLCVELLQAANALHRRWQQEREVSVEVHSGQAGVEDLWLRRRGRRDLGIIAVAGRLGLAGRNGLAVSQ
jgi:hypothetical protein